MLLVRTGFCADWLLAIPKISWTFKQKLMRYEAHGRMDQHIVPIVSTTAVAQITEGDLQLSPALHMTKPGAKVCNWGGKNVNNDTWGFSTVRYNLHGRLCWKSWVLQFLVVFSCASLLQKRYYLSPSDGTDRELGHPPCLPQYLTCLTENIYRCSSVGECTMYQHTMYWVRFFLLWVIDNSGGQNMS